MRPLDSGPAGPTAFDRASEVDDHEQLQNAMDEKGHEQRLYWRLGVSFFLFGLINNVLYVIILSAALDLVPPSTPKGIIAFVNIAPALVAKIGWPYLLKGRIRYTKRLIGYFASGTGAAGLVGAFLWWEVRNLGVRVGVGLSSIMPWIIPITYFFLLPHRSAFICSASPSADGDATTPAEDYSITYTPLPTTEEEAEEEARSTPSSPKRAVSLSANDKWSLVKPLLIKYMLPLFIVYLFEYTINQGIAPTLLYPVPNVEHHPVLSKFIHTIRDYYPLWQLVYQTTVFLSRSSITLGIPPLPASLLSLPAVLQALIFAILAFESAVGLFSRDDGAVSIITVFLLISLEGFCGGLAYVNVFYRINQERSDSQSAHDLERTKQEREFRIGSIGFADSCGILLAAVVAVPMEVTLCRAQISRGKTLCKGL
ncbi:hypothetical protein C0993_006867 [Termitomyces sp. T159_Od127]|nr:hypothetical protein C0993_006867 [Termitomyces sp. T159_Od127]